MVATPAQLREDVSAVADDAADALADLVRDVPRGDVLPALNDVLPGLILTYGETAAVVAAEWYDDARSAASASGRFSATPARLAPVGADALIGWAAKTATSFPTMLSLIEGGTRKRVNNGARLTVTRNAIRDPRADGWQRYARPDGCTFCKMLAGRTVLYRSESTAEFSAHDFCNCQAAVAFTGTPRPVKPYTPGPRERSKAGGGDYERAKAWLKSH